MANIFIYAKTRRIIGLGADVAVRLSTLALVLTFMCWLFDKGPGWAVFAAPFALTVIVCLITAYFAVKSERQNGL